MLFEQVYVAEILSVQRWKVLPVKDVLPYARDTGTHFSRIGRGQVQSRVDDNSVAIYPGEVWTGGYIGGHSLNAPQFLDHDAVYERLGQLQIAPPTAARREAER
jgi:hypothetical protein